MLKMLVETVRKSVTTKATTSASTNITTSNSTPVQGVSASKPQAKATPLKSTPVTASTSKPAVQPISATVSTTTTSAAKPVVSTQLYSVQTPKAPPTGDTPARSVVVKSPKNVTVSVSKLKVKDTVSSATKSSSPEQTDGAAMKSQLNVVSIHVHIAHEVPCSPLKIFI